jgi:hypothetical protein
MPKSRPKIEIRAAKDFTQVKIGDAFLIISDDRKRLGLFGGDDVSICAQEPKDKIAALFNPVVMKVAGVSIRCDDEGKISVCPPADGSMSVSRGPAIPAVRDSIDDLPAFRFRT